MGLLSWLKDVSSSEEERTLEEFSKDKLADEKWIEHYFKIGFERFPRESDKALNLRIANVEHQLLQLITSRMVFADTIKKDKNTLIFKGSLKKSITIKVIEPTKEHYEMLIRFSDYNEKGVKGRGGFIIREKKAGKEQDYLFSPMQTIILAKQNLLPEIEFALIRFLNIEPTEVMKQQKIMKYYSFVDGEPHYLEFDGIQYFGYPLEKRIELYAKNPKFDEIVFPTMDNDFFFKDFIEEIMEKKNHDGHMKKFCKAVEGLMKKYKVVL